jgi:hypothetical protein
MVHISMKFDDAAVLREILETQLLELRRELWHTDTRAFKELLKEREQVLARIVEQLPLAAA